MKFPNLTFYAGLVMFILLGSACSPAATATELVFVPTDNPSSTPTDTPPTETPAPTATSTITPTPTLEPTRTPAPTSIPLFRQLGTRPVVTIADGTWKNKYVDPGAVMYHDGAFHVFFNAFNSWPGRVSVGYTTSTDGVTWEEHEGPVFSAEMVDLDYVPYTLLASDVLVEDDGTWVLYFYTWDGPLATDVSVIGRATSTNPLGPWTADSQPLLRPETVPGYWDSFSVRSPSVVKLDEGYFMYYAGSDVTGVPVPQNDIQRIGMATSQDGITWEKYNNPDTTDKLFSRSDPVLSINDDRVKWDSARVHQPSVMFTPDGWVMFYRSTKGGVTNGGSQAAYGYARSTDGINWEIYEQNPVIRPSIILGGLAIWFTNMIYEDGIYYAFLEVGDGSNTRVYIAEGGLAP